MRDLDVFLAFGDDADGPEAGSYCDLKAYIVPALEEAQRSGQGEKVAALLQMALSTVPQPDYEQDPGGYLLVKVLRVYLNATSHVAKDTTKKRGSRNLSYRT